MNIDKILASCDHTLLAPTATPEEIRALCADGVKYKTASVCIPPSYVALAKECVGSAIRVCTVIGFPHGNSTPGAKAYEAVSAIAEGADEIDMVINIGRLKAGDYEYVLNDILAVRSATEGHILKVIVETCLLTDEEKIKVCELVTRSGADFIKTSTGFSTGGATFHDVELFAKHIGPGVSIKAAGGISSLEDAEHFMELGAKRLGTSRVVKLVKAM